MSKLFSLKVNKNMLGKYYLPRLNEKSPVVPNLGRIRGMVKPNGIRKFGRTEREIVELGNDFVKGLRLGFGIRINKRRGF